MWLNEGEANTMKGKKANMILKIDLEKAFDRLKWSFIYHTLRFFKFPPYITKFIMHCITTIISIAILVNSSVPQYLSPSREIR